MKIVIKWSLLVMAFVPLIVDTSVFFPYITGKTLLIRLAISLAAILFSIHLLSSEKFFGEMEAKSKKIFKNSVVLSTLTFFAVFVVSVFFAVNTYRAFYGNVERAEVLLGTMYFFGFLILSLFIFERKDWILFFKLNLLSGAALFVNEMYQWILQHTVRPSSFTGNSIYLAAYFLFVMLSGVIIIGDHNEKKYGFWKIFSWAMFPLSLFGIFVTETRGVIVGFGAGIVALIIYFVWKGKEEKLFNISLKKISAILLLAIIIFGGFFIATKKDSFWQKIPGLDRLSKVSSGDVSTETRLIAWGVGLQSVRPDLNGLGKFLIGWGPENFNIAYNTYYNPRYFEFEQVWFDRSHDKLIDVFVMNGFLGLIAYLAIWFWFFYIVLKRKNMTWSNGGLIFFGVSYFAQNLFVFDSVSTFTPFFAMLGYAVYLYLFEEKEPSQENIQKTKSKILSASLISISWLVSLFFIFCFVAFFLIPYFQMRNYIGILQSGDAAQYDTISNTLTPYTYAQENIRMSFLETTQQYAGSNQEATKLFNQALDSMKDLVQRDPTNPRYFLSLAMGYTYEARAENNLSYLKDAETQLRKAMALTPKRQDIRYQLSYNLAQQSRFPEAIALMKDTVALDPNLDDSYYYLAVVEFVAKSNYVDVYNNLETALSGTTFHHLGDGQTTITTIYENILSQAYQARNKDVFIGAAKRLESLSPDKKASLDNIINFAQQNKWAQIQLLKK